MFGATLTWPNLSHGEHEEVELEALVDPMCWRRYTSGVEPEPGEQEEVEHAPLFDPMC